MEPATYRVVCISYRTSRSRERKESILDKELAPCSAIRDWDAREYPPGSTPKSRLKRYIGRRRGTGKVALQVDEIQCNCASSVRVLLLARERCAHDDNQHGANVLGFHGQTLIREAARDKK